MELNRKSMSVSSNLPPIKKFLKKKLKVSSGFQEKLNNKYFQSQAWIKLLKEKQKEEKEKEIKYELNNIVKN